MAKRKTELGLGRGLNALLGDPELPQQGEGAVSLPISQVEPGLNQPRKRFDPESLTDLAESIRIHGIIQPLTVRRLATGYYQIIAGERRWRAAKQAGLDEVPAVIVEADDRKVMELALIENLQREDLNPAEAARGFQVLMDEYGLTQEQVAQALGVSGPAVNKWERGACCPDLALLAPLARLLDTDLNTLLSFREELTGAEIAAFTEELYTLAQSRGIDAAFLRAEELLHRWPGCDRLTISLAMTLNGLFFTLGVAEPEPYERRLEPLYRALADSEEPDIRDQALHLLIGRHMRRSPAIFWKVTS